MGVILICCTFGLIRLLYYLPMEKMLRKKKDNSEYEIDRELTWKFAIEKRAEYQEKIEQLEEKNKNLKEKVRFLEECLDRKEKLNEKYRKELKNYVYDAKQVRDIC